MLFKKISKSLSVLVALIFLIASVWYLIQHFQWRDAFSQLLATDFISLACLVLAVHFGYICVRTLRWQIVIRQSNPDVGFFDLYWITAVMVSLSIITPGQVGEALKIELLKRRGLLDRMPGLGGFALERILDLLVISGMGFIGLIYGSGISENYLSLKIGAGILFACGLLVLYLLFKFDPGGRTSVWLKRLRTGIDSPQTLIAMAFLTISSWILIGFGWQISLNAVKIYLSLPEIMWLISIVTLGTILSFIPGGVGVAEVLTVKVLVNMGVFPVMAQVGALILRSYALITIISGLLHLFIWMLHRLFTRTY